MSGTVKKKCSHSFRGHKHPIMLCNVCIFLSRLFLCRLWGTMVGMWCKTQHLKNKMYKLENTVAFQRTQYDCMSMMSLSDGKNKQEAAQPDMVLPALQRMLHLFVWSWNEKIRETLFCLLFNSSISLSSIRAHTGSSIKEVYTQITHRTKDFSSDRLQVGQILNILCTYNTHTHHIHTNCDQKSVEDIE